MPDVIVTGLPRSGATTVSALIDYLPNAVCLNSPAWHDVFAQKPINSLPFCKWIAGDFVWQRTQLLAQEPVADFRKPDGAPLTDGTGDQPPIYFQRPGLTTDFILGMKQHVLYTAVLPTLLEFRHFKIIAVIRNPLDTIAAWQKLPQPLIAKGKPNGIARFWPEILEVTDRPGDTLDKFVQIYEAFLQRYHELREYIHVVKYEDVVSNPGIVSEFLGVETLSAAASMIHARTSVRRAADVEPLRDRLRKAGVFAKMYYGDI